MANCTLSKENKIIISSMKEDIKSIKEGIRKLEERMIELYNHQSNRLPLWATTMITLLSSVVVGLSVAFIKS